MPDVRVSADVVQAGAGGMDTFVADAGAVYIATRRELHAVVAFMHSMAPSAQRLGLHLERRLALHLDEESARTRFERLLRRSESALSHIANDVMRSHLYSSRGAAAQVVSTVSTVMGATGTLVVCKEED